MANASHDQAQAHGLELAFDHHGNFSITIHHVTLQDSGVYCCQVLEIKHHHLDQRSYGYMELQVQTGEHSVQIPMAGGVGRRCLHLCHVTMYETMSDVPSRVCWLCKEWVWTRDYLVCASICGRVTFSCERVYVPKLVAFLLRKCRP